MQIPHLYSVRRNEVYTGGTEMLVDNLNNVYSYIPKSLD